MSQKEHSLTIDLHVHVDEKLNYELIPRVLRLRDLDGVGILTHNDFSFASKIMKRLKTRDKKKIYLAGVEVDTSEGHLVAYGIDQELPQDRSAEETIEIIHALGGIAIIPHPFLVHNSLGWNTVKINADAIEACNGFAKVLFNFPNVMAKVAFKNNDCSKVGGSDAHYVFAIGSCYSLIEIAKPAKEEAILEAIRKQKTKPIQRPIDKNDVVNFLRIIFGEKEGRKAVRIFD